MNSGNLCEISAKIDTLHTADCHFNTFEDSYLGRLIFQRKVGTST